jgi:hypothetical protein
VQGLARARSRKALATERLAGAGVSRLSPEGVCQSLRMAVLPVRGRPAWLIGSAAVAAEVGAAVAFTVEARRDVEELTWSVYLWAAGGIMALVALTLSLASRPRESGRRPAVIALLIMVALALIFFAAASGTE